MARAELPERVAYLEGKVDEHSHAWQELRESILQLDGKVDRFREELYERIDATNSRIDSLERRIDVLDQKYSPYFLWIIGIQITSLLAIITVLLRR